MNYIFYDTETTGISTAFDQILQFAAICTDSNLVEIGRFNIRCRLLPHIVPAFKALQVTGVSIHQLNDESNPTYYQMIKLIQEKLKSWSPAIFIGYNSLNFDEHLLRQAFYQTLHPLYLTNTGGSSRLDLMRIVQATSLFAPNAINVPLNEKGKQTYRLDKLAPANGFTHEDAHDALADVEACIHLSKLLQKNASELWNMFVDLSQKSSISKYIQAEPFFSLSDFSYNRPSSWIVSYVGANPQNNSEAILFNLEYDPAEFIDLSLETLKAKLKTSSKAILSLRLNACPIIMPASIAPQIAAASALGMKELERRTDILHSDVAFKERLLAAQSQTADDKEPSPHIEEQIYTGFFSSKDQKILEEFHRTPWEKRADLIPKLEDSRLRLLAYRLIHFERPDLLDKSRQQEHMAAIARRLLTQESVPWLTLRQALDDVDALIKDQDSTDQKTLNEYREYILNRIQQESQILEK